MVKRLIKSFQKKPQKDSPEDPRKDLPEIAVLFDANWYKEKYPSWSTTHKNPIEHYLKVGANEGIDPHPLFSTNYYLRSINADIGETGNPLVHFLREGGSKGFSPHPSFDSAWYLHAYRDVAEAGLNPLVHYLQFGAKEGRKPSEFFDTTWYLNEYPEVRESGLNPLVHYVIFGSDKGYFRNPIEKAIGRHVGDTYVSVNDLSRLFDADWYRKKNPDCTHSYGSALEHYLEVGAKAGLDPHPLFSTRHYILANEGRVDAISNPLVHFLIEGGRKGLSTHPLFDSEWYLRTYSDVANDGLIPLIHYLEFGAKEGRNPSESFDTNWYLNEYPDVRNAGINPLVHYVLHGRSEGRYRNALDKRIAEVSTLSKEVNAPVIDLNGLQFNEADYSFLFDSQEIASHDLQNLSVPPDVRLISFDVWDTLLRRDCHPDEIKLCSARYLFVNYYWLLRPAYRDMGALVKTRFASENRVSRTADYEYRYGEVLPVWLMEVFEKGVVQEKIASVVAELLEHEYIAESRASRRDEISAKWLKDSKLPVAVFSSDFYMPSQFLQRLLEEKAVPATFVKGYSSSDLIKNKRSGELFKHILDDFDLAPRELLHVGDNNHSDVKVPNSLGINSIHYEHKREHDRRQWLELAYKEKIAGDIKLHEQRLIALVEGAARVLWPKNATMEQASLFHFGVRFSVVAIGFVLHIVEEAKRFGVDVIYFFTREGIFLRSLYDKVVASDPYYSSYPRSELLEVSRIATFGPSLQEINTKNLMRLWSQYSTQSPRALFKSLNLDREEIAQIFNEAGLDYEQSIQYPWQNKKLEQILQSDEVQRLATSSLGEQRSLLRAYFAAKGIGDSAKAALIVDLGWRGTIQDNICHIFSQHFHGCYLGLFGFLNEQPLNSSKSGWLFNLNRERNSWSPGEVAPLEMIFNSPGGTATHYLARNDGVVTAAKKIEADEDRVFFERTQWIQEGILAAVKPVVDYVAMHGLTADDLKQLARRFVDSLVDRPPSVVAQGFFELLHNETFGTGENQDMNVVQEFRHASRSLDGSRLHAFTKEFLQRVRWPRGFVRLPQNQLGVSNEKITHYPLDVFRAVAGLERKQRIRIGIYLPPPLIGSGGHRTIFNMARKFIQAGCEVYCFLESEGAGVDVAHDYLGGERAFVNVGWVNFVELDVAFATIAHSARYVAGLKGAKHKAYLVQDFEAWFNPVGDAYTVAENSYTYGLTHFTIGNWLTHVLNTQYGASAIPAGLGVDTGVYKTEPLIAREKAICFLYQPEKPRRNPTLGIDALRLVKWRHPDVKIYVYGSDSPVHLDFEVENLGLVRDLAKLNELYNRCSVGLCISMSNPSRIPYEMMAAGAVPVDVYRYNNLMDYETGTIKLAYQSPDSLARAICELLEDDVELEQRRKASMEFASVRSLDWEMDVIVNSVLSMVNGRLPAKEKSMILFGEQPTIADIDNRDEVRKFCNWQYKMAAN